MWRDVGQLSSDGYYGWFLMLLVIGLAGASIAYIASGNRWAWLSLAVPIGMVVAWYLYYATDWWVVEVGDSKVILVPALFGWVVLGLVWLAEGGDDDLP